MNEQPPPPSPSVGSLRGPWIAWIIASTLLPGLPFLLIGKKGLDDGMPLVALAIIAQLVCSVLLALQVAKKRGKGPGHVVLMTFVFMVASVIIGSVSFFAACLVASPNMNFH